MSGQVSRGSAGAYQADERQVSRGLAGEYQERLDLPRDLISTRLSRLSLPGDLHPDPAIPSSEVATVLGRIRFRKAYS